MAYPKQSSGTRQEPIKNGQTEVESESAAPSDPYAVPQTRIGLIVWIVGFLLMGSYLLFELIWTLLFRK